MAKGRLSSGSCTGGSSSKVLLFILTLLIGNSCFFTSAAESDSVMSLVAGIDKASEVLVDHNDRCSSGPLSHKVEENVSWLEGLLERQWDMIDDVRGKVDNATRRVQELVDHYYTVSPTEAPDACAAPFRRVAGSCFWLHKNPAQTWKLARGRCQQEGADLATPRDIPAVIQFLQGYIGREWTYVWFGGKRGSHGRWKWLKTDVNMNIDSSLWHNSTGGGNCVMFNGGRGYKVNHWDCNDECWYLCEKKIE